MNGTNGQQKKSLGDVFVRHMVDGTYCEFTRLMVKYGYKDIEHVEFDGS